MTWALLIGLSACQNSTSVAPDADRDGFDATLDCDDADADAFPGAVEFCDGRDNDCNGEVDDDAVDSTEFFLDGDGDGVGSQSVSACEAPEGAAERGGDCDDTDGEVRPGRTERCNGIDDDCDGTVDVEPDEPVWFDGDGDGFGDPEAPLHTCTPPPAYVSNRADCDDSTADIHPNADEVCNGLDDDCDHAIDDADSDRIDPPTWFPDADEDGFGAPGFEVEACEPPAGPWSMSSADCDDFDPNRFPGAVEVCDGIDDDCDGAVDGPGSVPSRALSVGVELSATRASDRPVFAAVVDLRQAFEDAGGAGDIGEVVLARGTCDAGVEWHPARFVDSWSDLGVPGADGDGTGVLVVAGPEGSGTLLGTLYFNDQAIGDASASPSVLTSGGDSVHLDGPRFDTPGGLLSQATFGPRVETPAGTIEIDLPSQVEVDSHPTLSRVVASGTSTGPGGEVSWEVEWWRLSGGTESHLSIHAASSQPTDVFHPVQSGSGVVAFAVGTQGTLSTVDGDPQVDDGTTSVAIRSEHGTGEWVPGPTWLEFRGSEGAPTSPLWSVGVGTVLMDHRFVLGDSTDALDDSEPMPLELVP